MESLTVKEADFLNNLMPGNQVMRLGTKLKYALDQINDVTDGGTDSIKFDNSIVPVYGQDHALVSIGTWNTPMTVAPTAAYAPLQVNLTNATNVSGDLAAARLKLITTAACAATNLNVLELRCTIGGNINQWATLQCSCAPAAHTITTGEGLVSYFKMEGSGAITPAGSNAVAVMEVINEHLGTGVSDVAIFRNNATGYGAGNVVKIENIIGTATNLLHVLRTAGTVTNGINIEGTLTTGLTIGAGSVTSIAALTPMTVIHAPSSATPGTVRSITGRITPAATVTSGNLVGVRGEINLTPNSSAMSGCPLYGVQGKIIMGAGSLATANMAYAAVFGQLDAGTATITAGKVAGVYADLFGFGTGTYASVNGIRVEHVGGGVINSLIQIEGKSTYVFDISSNTHNQMSTTGTAGATSAKGWLKVKVDGADRYIPLTDSVS